MPVFYLMYHAEPLAENEKEMNVMGAYINCWLVSETLEQAEEIALVTIQNEKWHPLTLDEGFEITSTDYIGDPKGLEVYEQALINKEVYSIHTYESRDE